MMSILGSVMPVPESEVGEGGSGVSSVVER